MRLWDRAEPSPQEAGGSALAIARGRWWVIATTAVTAVAVAIAALALARKSYQATATLQAPIATGVQTPTDLTYLDRVMNTYTRLAQQPDVRAAVARRLGRAHAPRISVTVEPNTQFMQLSATDHSPAIAQRAANVGATVLIARATALAQATAQAAEEAISAQVDSLSNRITQMRIQLASLPPGPAYTTQHVTLRQAIAGEEANFQALVQQRAQLQLADAEHSQTLSVVQPASLPTAPSSPRYVPILALAIVLGLIGGVGIAFMQERIRPRSYTVEEIEHAADAAVLAAIPPVRRDATSTPLYNGGSPAQEAFGVLAVHVLAEATVRTLRSILVTSRKKGDGKSVVASNLAAELARSGHRVVLVDADMRSPTVHEIFGLNPRGGLSDLLADRPAASERSRFRADLARSRRDNAALPDTTSPYIPSSGTSTWSATKAGGFVLYPPEIPNLGVLAAGDEPAGPAHLLASAQLNRLIEELHESFEFIVFDSPPLVVSDPLSIARLVDLVLLVVAGGPVPHHEIQAATRQLSSIGVKHVSVVANRWRPEAPYEESFRSFS
jgi:polysaccharide biosynthesis transport protein